MTNKHVQQELIKLLNARSVALVEKDIEFFKRHLSEDFCYINASGKVFNKSAYLEFFIASDTMQWQSQILDQYNFRLYGDIAVVTCRIHDEATFQGMRFDGYFQSTQLFIKREGAWHYISGQTTNIE
jgi:uncharacterized protein YchJ